MAIPDQQSIFNEDIRRRMQDEETILARNEKKKAEADLLCGENGRSGYLSGHRTENGREKTAKIFEG